MSSQTKPYFLVGSGRSGTRTMFKLLSGVQGMEAYHEYVCTHIQQTAAMAFMGLLSRSEVIERIQSLHGSAIYYSKADRWMDCSNKLSWVIPALHELFPDARFIHLVRDGRKVASSYYHKLADEMYADESVSTLQGWLEDRSLPPPPPEKKYWWNIPQQGQPFYESFPSFNQFERACYHWAESNRVILEALEDVPESQRLFLKLEEVVSQREVLSNFLKFCEVPFEEHFFEFLQSPQNVIFPMDFKLGEEQVAQFDAIASPMMHRLGYAGTEEYGVTY